MSDRGDDGEDNDDDTDKVKDTDNEKVNQRFLHERTLFKIPTFHIDPWTLLTFKLP